MDSPVNGSIHLNVPSGVRDGVNLLSDTVCPDPTVYIPASRVDTIPMFDVPCNYDCPSRAGSGPCMCARKRAAINGYTGFDSASKTERMLELAASAMMRNAMATISNYAANKIASGTTDMADMVMSSDMSSIAEDMDEKIGPQVRAMANEWVSESGDASATVVSIPFEPPGISVSVVVDMDTDPDTDPSTYSDVHPYPTRTPSPLPPRTPDKSPDLSSGSSVGDSLISDLRTPESGGSGGGVDRDSGVDDAPEDPLESVDAFIRFVYAAHAPRTPPTPMDSVMGGTNVTDDTKTSSDDEHETKWYNKNASDGMGVTGCVITEAMAHQSVMWIVASLLNKDPAQDEDVAFAHAWFDEAIRTGRLDKNRVACPDDTLITRLTAIPLSDDKRLFPGRVVRLVDEDGTPRDSVLAIVDFLMGEHYARMRNRVVLFPLSPSDWFLFEICAALRNNDAAWLKQPLEDNTFKWPDGTLSNYATRVATGGGSGYMSMYEMAMSSQVADISNPRRYIYYVPYILDSLQRNTCFHTFEFTWAFEGYRDSPLDSFDSPAVRDIVCAMDALGRCLENNKGIQSLALNVYQPWSGTEGPITEDQEHVAVVLQIRFWRVLARALNRNRRIKKLMLNMVLPRPERLPLFSLQADAYATMIEDLRHVETLIISCDGLTDHRPLHQPGHSRGVCTLSKQLTVYKAGVFKAQFSEAAVARMNALGGRLTTVNMEINNHVQMYGGETRDQLGGVSHEIRSRGNSANLDFGMGPFNNQDPNIGDTRYSHATKKRVVTKLRVLETQAAYDMAKLIVRDRYMTKRFPHYDSVCTRLDAIDGKSSVDGVPPPDVHGTYTALTKSVVRTATDEFLNPKPYPHGDDEKSGSHGGPVQANPQAQVDAFMADVVNIGDAPAAGNISAELAAIIDDPAVQDRRRYAHYLSTDPDDYGGRVHEPPMLIPHHEEFEVDEPGFCQQCNGEDATQLIAFAGEHYVLPYRTCVHSKSKFLKYQNTTGDSKDLRDSGTSNTRKAYSKLKLAYISSTGKKAVGRRRVCVERAVQRVAKAYRSARCVGTLIVSLKAPSMDCSLASGTGHGPNGLAGLHSEYYQSMPFMLALPAFGDNPHVRNFKITSGLLASIDAHAVSHDFFAETVQILRHSQSIETVDVSTPLSPLSQSLLFSALLDCRSLSLRSLRLASWCVPAESMDPRVLMLSRVKDRVALETCASPAFVQWLCDAYGTVSLFERVVATRRDITNVSLVYTTHHSQYAEFDSDRAHYRIVSALAARGDLRSVLLECTSSIQPTYDLWNAWHVFDVMRNNTELSTMAVVLPKEATSYTLESATQSVGDDGDDELKLVGPPVSSAMPSGGRHSHRVDPMTVDQFNAVFIDAVVRHGSLTRLLINAEFTRDQLQCMFAALLCHEKKGRPVVLTRLTLDGMYNSSGYPRRRVLNKRGRGHGDDPFSSDSVLSLLDIGNTVSQRLNGRGLTLERVLSEYVKCTRRLESLHVGVESLEYTVTVALLDAMRDNTSIVSFSAPPMSTDVEYVQLMGAFSPFEIDSTSGLANPRHVAEGRLQRRFNRTAKYVTFSTLRGRQSYGSYSADLRFLTGGRPNARHTEYYLPLATSQLFTFNRGLLALGQSNRLGDTPPSHIDKLIPTLGVESSLINVYNTYVSHELAVLYTCAAIERGRGRSSGQSGQGGQCERGKLRGNWPTGFTSSTGSTCDPLPDCTTDDCDSKELDDDAATTTTRFDARAFDAFVSSPLFDVNIMCLVWSMASPTMFPKSATGGSRGGSDGDCDSPSRMWEASLLESLSKTPGLNASEIVRPTVSLALRSRGGLESDEVYRQGFDFGAVFDTDKVDRLKKSYASNASVLMPRRPNDVSSASSARVCRVVAVPLLDMLTRLGDAMKGAARAIESEQGADAFDTAANEERMRLTASLQSMSVAATVPDPSLYSPLPFCVDTAPPPVLSTPHKRTASVYELPVNPGVFLDVTVADLCLPQTKAGRFWLHGDQMTDAATVTQPSAKAESAGNEFKVDDVVYHEFDALLRLDATLSTVDVQAALVEACLGMPQGAMGSPYCCEPVPVVGEDAVGRLVMGPQARSGDPKSLLLDDWIDWDEWEGAFDRDASSWKAALTARSERISTAKWRSHALLHRVAAAMGLFYEPGVTRALPSISGGVSTGLLTVYNQLCRLLDVSLVSGGAGVADDATRERARIRMTAERSRAFKRQRVTATPSVTTTTTTTATATPTAYCLYKCSRLR